MKRSTLKLKKTQQEKRSKNGSDLYFSIGDARWTDRYRLHLIVFFLLLKIRGQPQTVHGMSGQAFHWIQIFQEIQFKFFSQLN